MIVVLTMLFSLVCGLATAMLIQRTGRGSVAAALAGFAATGTTIVLGVNLMLMVAALV
ncbi:hypothetical protein AB0L82_35420 [Nocardia sp. NPDC052001]|uniref:hypothetical protein n=1 Tax=Nocardia sp. NPDC052001 TaxID=3154853 RepID=UPI003441306A